VCDNEVAFFEGILILTTVEGRFKKGCRAPGIISAVKNVVLFLTLFSDRM
jgi:hypothetical protein